jgi:hypothetical protein
MGGMSKIAVGALCDAGRDDLVGDFSNCRVGGNGYWRQDIPLIEAGTAAPPADSPDRLLDEFSHLRLALEHIGLEVANGSGELQLGATLTRPCASPEDLHVGSRPSRV